MRQATNNEPLVGITVPRGADEEKYSGINSTINISSSSE
jgi:hypothetical protein